MEERKGFTLIEIIVAIAIIILLVSVSVVQFATFGNNIELTTSSQNLTAALQLAQNKTLASEEDTQYGVFIDAGSFTIFQGAAYNENAPANEVHTIPESVEIYSINVGNNDAVVFDRVTGATTNTGSIFLRLKNNQNNTKEVAVQPSGAIGIAVTSTPSGTRVTDTRHLHFDLGWSIQTAETLTFSFPDDNYTEDIVMYNFFDAGLTDFMWEGTIDVNGTSESFLVHTHSLDTFDTELSIRRDGRFTSKAVDIFIDGKSIASYDENDNATLGGFPGRIWRVNGNSINMHKGFSIIEVIIAIAIALMVFVGIYEIFIISTVATKQNIQKTQATHLAEEAIDVMKSLRNIGWTDNISVLQSDTLYYPELVTSTWNMSLNDPGPADGYTTMITLYDVYRDGADDIAAAGTLDPNTKHIVSRVEWEHKGNTKSVELESYLTNFLQN